MVWRPGRPGGQGGRGAVGEWRREQKDRRPLVCLCVGRRALGGRCALRGAPVCACASAHHMRARSWLGVRARCLALPLAYFSIAAHLDPGVYTMSFEYVAQGVLLPRPRPAQSGPRGHSADPQTLRKRHYHSRDHLALLPLLCVYRARRQAARGGSGGVQSRGGRWAHRDGGGPARAALGPHALRLRPSWRT